MKQWFDKITDIAALGTSKSKLEDSLAELAHQLGFGGYAYLYLQPGQSFAISNYPPEWQELYFERKYAAIDPIVKLAKTCDRAFVWSGDKMKSRLSLQEQNFLAHASDFGVRSGATIPIRTANGFMSVFTLASKKPVLYEDKDIDPVMAAAAVAQLHARITFLQIQPTSQENGYLNSRESTYLRWVAVGKSMREVADIEGVKYNTVRVKLNQARKRFDVYNISHLLAVAIRRSLI
ncbi:autoinducer-binding transcriptional regulator TraR [Oryzicola mucosus]|uniref:Transcriptional regulator TraR n=1 Tax=Oryzicola mucosus TaxID=2767425 RepID=A0A8J6PX67_9HYPH|nr:transcriptional regulator TraR [Oryzicola mucosus]MBD0416821.1 transcriptional regulator TraR [Oryzicola mucosus]